MLNSEKIEKKKTKIKQKGEEEEITNKKVCVWFSHLIIKLLKMYNNTFSDYLINKSLKHIANNRTHYLRRNDMK